MELSLVSTADLLGSLTAGDQAERVRWVKGVALLSVAGMAVSSLLSWLLAALASGASLDTVQALRTAGPPGVRTGQSSTSPDW